MMWDINNIIKRSFLNLMRKMNLILLFHAGLPPPYSCWFPHILAFCSHLRESLTFSGLSRSFSRNQGSSCVLRKSGRWRSSRVHRSGQQHSLSCDVYSLLRAFGAALTRQWSEAVTQSRSDLWAHKGHTFPTVEKAVENLGGGGKRPLSVRP